MEVLNDLQKMGAVPAIDLAAYSRALTIRSSFEKEEGKCTEHFWAT